MRNLSLVAVALSLGAGLAGCTSGNAAIEPPFSGPTLATTTKVQFAVGTANIRGTAGLNTVVTFRQTNGLSAVLLDSPSIAGPAGFAVPAASSAGGDAGTSNITSTPQTLPGNTAAATTFGQSGGAFAYGFAPANSTTSGAANFPQYGSNSAINNGLSVADPDANGGGAILNAYAQPIYGTTKTKLPYIGGPPAYPFFNDGTFPTGFLGYPAGFTAFAATPVTGTYTLNINVPSGNTAAYNTPAVPATLNSTALLPAFANPTFTSDGAGGGTVGVTVPAGVTEALVYVVDFAQNPNTGGYAVTNWYTLKTTASGAQTLTLPDLLGALANGKQTQSINSGDTYFVYAVGFDYPAFEAGPPGNTSQTPTITGANGQADVTLSGFATGTY